ncbi:MAG: sodium-dependent transporter, partial [Clostridium sp.]|nr:sodium-dependent transporter [Clostridium sp.]
MNKKTNNFSSRIGFVLAAAGSAVGLGNLWRFPYLAAKYGGGIFLLIYLLLAITFGFALMITEIAIGRKTGKSAITAFASLDKRYSFIGYLACLVPVIIFPYYCVIGGWVVKYTAVFLKGEVTQATDPAYFTNFIGSTKEPLIWLLVFMVVCAVIVVMGVQKGVEKVSKFLMPILVILSIIVAAYVVTIDGAKEGVIYFLKPDFSRFSGNAVLAAMGQLFYS